MFTVSAVSVELCWYVQHVQHGTELMKFLGMYVPYITKTYLSTSDPPVNLVKFAIGGEWQFSSSVRISDKPFRWCHKLGTYL